MDAFLNKVAPCCTPRTSKYKYTKPLRIICSQKIGTWSQRRTNGFLSFHLTLFQGPSLVRTFRHNQGAPAALNADSNLCRAKPHLSNAGSLGPECNFDMLRPLLEPFCRLSNHARDLAIETSPAHKQEGFHKV